MSTKSIFTFQIIAGVLLLSLLVFGCSGSDSDKTPIPLEGLWAITDTLTITMPEEEEPAVEEPTEEDSAGGEETTEGEGGTPEGAAPLKKGGKRADRGNGRIHPGIGRRHLPRPEGHQLQLFYHERGRGTRFIQRQLPAKGKRIDLYFGQRGHHNSGNIAAECNWSETGNCPWGEAAGVDTGTH